MWRIGWIFVFCLVLAAQAGPDDWTRPIEVLITSGRLADARSRLEQEKTTRGETGRFLYLEARLLFEQKRYGEALETSRRSVALAPADAESLKLTALSAIRLNRLDIAEPALKAAAQLAPHDYLIHFHLGALYYTRSLFQAARPELQRAVQLNREYMPALLFLGLTLEEVGDEKSTIETYRRAIDAAETQHIAVDTPYTSLAKYLYRLNRFDDSLPLLRKAVAINPRSGEVWLELGKTLHALKRDAEAVNALEHAVSADGRNSEPHYLLFRIYESTGRVREAEEELKQFQLFRPPPVEDPARRRVPAPN